MPPPLLNADRLRRLLGDLRRARVGVVGDFCVDSYYLIDAAAAEPSLETGLSTRPVREQRHTLGGAGNVVANLQALGVADLRAFGVIGPDLRGAELLRLLQAAGAATSGIITQPAAWQTHAYLKPILGHEELNRFDFGRFNVLADPSREGLLAALAAALPTLDVLVVNQQFDRGLHTAEFQAGLNALLARHPRVRALVDCRQLAAAYPGGLHKLNDLEAARLCGRTHAPRTHIPRAETLAAAAELFQRWSQPVFVSCGSQGGVAVDATGVHEVPGLHLLGKIDPVGAGDSLVAGLAACLAVGATPAEAASFGNLVASVTVQKLQQTGTATPAEILAIGEHPDYVYQPELAADPRRAAYAPGTAIELALPLPAGRPLRHAIFDHDGTISTLRQGWEQIMEPMMIQAILGPAESTADPAAREQIVRQTREFISQTTGIQTLQQMHGLARMVREAGWVPADQILDAAGYKRRYNEALMNLVEQRLARLHRGELGVWDFTLQEAVPFLQQLRQAGLRLYLASGTDEPDVIREAEELGYASLFEGRIYGANQDMAHDAKRLVLDRILREIGPGEAGQIVTFGDGPVEIRETRKRGGVTVGLASDEVRRCGLQLEKRTRLIRAGAHLVIPDFSESAALLGLLGLNPTPQA
ncbi:MAG: PfkB family carbohydrate kinase [Opitutales bacterium]|nr:PfkB family carbohydrate kinase [Opitutales bacterium]